MTKERKNGNNLLFGMKKGKNCKKLKKIPIFQIFTSDLLVFPSKEAKERFSQKKQAINSFALLS